jgi:hypothetical protein
MPTGEAASAPTRSGVLLALLAAVLAALLASAPVRDADVWRHLASGRALTAGRLPHLDGWLDAPAGPAASSWLYDVSLYGAFRLVGGAGLVALSAGLAALVMALVFRAGRLGADTVPAGVGAILTAVALGPWFGVNPGFVSCLLMAVMVLLIGRVGREAEGEAGPTWAGWLLPCLAVVWANADAWVVLAPVAVGLTALGERLRGRARSARALGLLTLAVAAASLASPNHVQAWAALPGQAGWGPTATPFWPSWFRGSPPAAAAAFYALTALGLVAFAAGRGGPAWSLAPLWVALLGLAAWRPAAAPFVAVVASPVAAVGLAALTGRAPVVTRRLAVAAAAALVLAAWPGWLQGQPHGRRAWSLEEDGSLRDAVEQIRRWRSAGAFGPDNRGLTLSPEAAAYWAWFGPDEGPTEPLPAFPATDGAAMWIDLLDGGTGWREVLRGRRVRYLVLANCAAQPAASLVTRLAAAPDEWPLLYLRGRTVVFGWRDPQGAGWFNQVSGLKLDLEARAFRPDAADRAPTERPGQRSWWRSFVDPPAPPPAERDEAALYLAFFDAQRPRYQAQARADWLSFAWAGLAGGLADAGRGPAALGCDAGLRLAWVRHGWGAFAAGEDDGPPGLPLLAVRAARRALHDSPDDARSHFLLGEAYLRLAQATREREWRRQLPPFDRLRQVQAITAFARAAALRPDSVEAHGRLARLYRDRGSLDLALRHLARLVEAVRSRGAQPGESDEAFRDRLASLGQEMAALEEEVGRRESSWREGAGQRRALDLAREAAALGLPGLALETLLKSDSSEFGPEGSKLELELLLWAGRAEDVRAWADPDLKASLGALAYHEILAGLAAATGEYGEVWEHLREITATVERGPGGRPARERAALDVARAALQAPMADRSPGALAHASLMRIALIDDARQVGEALRREANARVVQGLLALEAGQVEAAAEAMRRAVATWGSAAASASGGGVDFSGRAAAQDCLRWLGGRQPQEADARATTSSNSSLTLPPRGGRSAACPTPPGRARPARRTPAPAPA